MHAVVEPVPPPQVRHCCWCGADDMHPLSAAAKTQTPAKRFIGSPSGVTGSVRHDGGKSISQRTRTWRRLWAGSYFPHPRNPLPCAHSALVLHPSWIYSTGGGSELSSNPDEWLHDPTALAMVSPRSLRCKPREYRLGPIAFANRAAFLQESGNGAKSQSAQH